MRVKVGVFPVLLAFWIKIFCLFIAIKQLFGINHKEENDCWFHSLPNQGYAEIGLLSPARML